MDDVAAEVWAGGTARRDQRAIHPAVASFLGLEWYDASKSTYQSYGGISYTYETYFEEMVR